MLLSPFLSKFRPFSSWRLGESSELVQLTLSFSFIPRTSRRLSIGVFPLYPLYPLVFGSPFPPLLRLPFFLPLPFLPPSFPGVKFLLLRPCTSSPFSFCSLFWEYHVPTPYLVPSSRCEEIQLQPPEIWSPDPCQPHSHDFLTDAIVRKMSRMFCQAARGRVVNNLPFYRPES